MIHCAAFCATHTLGQHYMDRNIYWEEKGRRRRAGPDIYYIYIFMCRIYTMIIIAHTFIRDTHKNIYIVHNMKYKMGNAFSPVYWRCFFLTVVLYTIHLCIYFDIQYDKILYASSLHCISVEMKGFIKLLLWFSVHKTRTNIETDKPIYCSLQHI